MKKMRRWIKHFLVPHKGNRYRPYIFSRQVIAAMALALCLIEGAYLLQVHVSSKIRDLRRLSCPPRSLHLRMSIEDATDWQD